jgi:hypothetical protein
MVLYFAKMGTGTNSELVPVLRVQKQFKLIFLKNRQDVFSTRYQP